MTTPINFDLEKHLLNGCTILRIDSVNYQSSKGDYTHALLQCPKEYTNIHSSDKRPASFISVEVYDTIPGKWFESTFYYSNKRHALKSYLNNLTEDRISKNRMKELTKN